jgi:hypothetical protein
LKALRWVVLAIIAVVAWLAASRRRRAEIALGYAIQKRKAGLDKPGMDEDFAHQVTPADPVQAFRNGGVV